jgi:hypothetical protein
MSLSKVLEIPRPIDSRRPSGDVKIRHAGPSRVLRVNSNRHPGSFSVQVQRPAWIPASAGMTDHATTSGLELTATQALFNDLQQSFYHLSACDGNSLSL